MRPPFPLITLLLALLCPAVSLSSKADTIYREFRNESFRLLDYLTRGDGRGLAFDWLAALVDDVGPRLLGSKALDVAIDRVVADLRKEGFDNVHTEDVSGLPNWQRGEDRVFLLEPREHELSILAIGGSSPGDVTAEGVVLEDFHGLEQSNVSGKIVVFVERWTGYGSTVSYRNAARRVQNAGGVGVLVKSVSPFSLYSPHTGSGGSGATIPTVSITIEEAEMLLRLQRRGKKLVLRMNVKSSPLPDPISSRNIVFDITGSEFPSSVVLLSGHLDSWDVGQGAMDDGGGVAAVLFALKAIKDLGLRPRRTLRGVFWTAEEEGLLGARRYFATHPGNTSSERFFFVSETDQGAFRPTNWHSALNFQGTDAQFRRLDDIVRILNAYDIPLTVQDSTSQGDVVFWANQGVPSANYVSDKGRDFYFYFHHTQADYMTIFKDGDLEFTSGIFAVLAHCIGNMDEWD